MPETVKSFSAHKRLLRKGTKSTGFREIRRSFATILRMTLRRLVSLAILTAFLAAAPFLLSLQASSAAPDGGSSGVSIAASLGVAPDLDARMARFKPFEMPFDRSGFSERERRLVEKLVDAANNIERIYWRQSDPEGLKLYTELEKSQDPLDRKVLQFLKANGSRYDLIDELHPFVGNEPAPPGRALYPKGLSVAEV
jgi:hypothetical protein